MQSDHLTLISHTVLALIGRHGASPHDLVRMMRRGRIYHAAAASQYYAEPKAPGAPRPAHLLQGARAHP